MLTTVKAEIDAMGNVRLLEPLEVSKKSKGLFTLLEDSTADEATGNAKSVLDFLRTHRLPEHSRPTSEEIEAHVEEARDSWD